MAKLRVSKKVAQQSPVGDHSSPAGGTTAVPRRGIQKRTLLQESTSQDDWRRSASPDVVPAGKSSGLSAAISGAVELTRQRREKKLEKRRGRATANAGDFGKWLQCLCLVTSLRQRLSESPPALYPYRPLPIVSLRLSVSPGGAWV